MGRFELSSYPLIAAQAMDVNKLRFYFNNCTTDALEPDDKRYVAIDQMEGKPRGLAWADKIARYLEMAREPSTLLITGLRGTGKSTELLKLAQRLGSAGGPHHLVVLIDGSEVLDLANEIDIPDILNAIVHATERKVLADAEGLDPNLALEDGFVKRLWHWMTNANVKLGQINLTPMQQGGLVLETKTNPTLRQQIRETLQQHFTTFIGKVRQELQLLEDRARTAGFQRITVIFDSLEKLQGLSSNWREVLASAERVFGGGAAYLSLPVHVVYTVPPALLNRRTDRIEFMPMVKLFTRTGERHPPGFQAMRELARLRVPDDAIAEMLGPTHEERMDELIAHTGGHPRLLIQMLQWLLLLPEFPATDDDILRLFAEQRERYQAVVTLEDHPWLHKVRRDKKLTLGSSDQLESVDRALTNNVIFRYANADVWYDVHPALPELFAASPQGPDDD
jgi:hypothetical protein